MCRFQSIHGSRQWAPACRRTETQPQLDFSAQKPTESASGCQQAHSKEIFPRNWDVIVALTASLSPATSTLGYNGTSEQSWLCFLMLKSPTLRDRPFQFINLLQRVFSAESILHCRTLEVCLFVFPVKDEEQQFTTSHRHKDRTFFVGLTWLISSLPSSISDRENQEKTLSCPHVLFTHGSKFFLSGCIQNWT